MLYLLSTRSLVEGLGTESAVNATNLINDDIFIGTTKQITKFETFT